MSGVAYIEDKSVPVRVTLKISNEKNRFWVHYVDVIKNTDDIFGLGTKNANPTDTKLSSVDDSVAQENPNVNPSDEKKRKQQRIETPGASEVLSELFRDNPNLNGYAEQNKKG